MEKKQKQSFILVKPDALENEFVLKDLFEQIEVEKLSISTKEKVTIENSKVSIIWPYCESDIVCKILMTRYLCGKELLLLFLTDLEGEDAILKTTRIKRSIREKYGTSPFQSCIHTPRDEAELEKDLGAILKKKAAFDFVNPTIIGDFPILDTIEYGRYEKCALALEEYMSKYSFELSYKNKLEESKRCKSKYNLFLVDDHVHDGRFLAGVILEVMSGYSVEQAYYTAFGVSYLGDFPLFWSEELDDIRETIENLESYGIKVELRDI